jgi:hypothetical protein
VDISECCKTFWKNGEEKVPIVAQGHLEIGACCRLKSHLSSSKQANISMFSSQFMQNDPIPITVSIASRSQNPQILQLQRKQDGQLLVIGDFSYEEFINVLHLDMAIHFIGLLPGSVLSCDFIGVLRKLLTNISLPGLLHMQDPGPGAGSQRSLPRHLT